MSDTVEASVGSSETSRFSFRPPRPTGMGSHFNRSKFVEANYPRVLWPLFIEPVDAFFLDANSGSLLSFHVLVLWKVTPFSFRIRCKVLGLVFLTIPLSTTKSANLRKDQTPKGRPNTLGGADATSMMTLTSSGVCSRGRPVGLRGRSALKEL